MANRSSRTTEKDAIFFEEFARSANVTAACALSGYAKTSVYEWRKTDQEFAARWENADKEATVNLEAEMYRRAVFGVTRYEPMLHQGKIVVTKKITEYSDTLAIFLAKARNPEKYRERIEVNINWRQELKQLNINPDQYLAQMIEVARMQLEAQETLEDNGVIDVTPIYDGNITDRSES